MLEAVLLNNDTRETLAKKEQEMKDREESKIALTRISQTSEIQPSESPVNFYQIQAPKNDENRKAKLSSQQATDVLNMFVMAIVWSFGASLHASGRELLSQNIHESV